MFVALKIMYKIKITPCLKGVLHEIFYFRFFYHNSVSSRAPEYSLGDISNFEFRISACLHLKVNAK